MGARVDLDKIVKVNVKQPPFKRSDSMKVSSHSKTYRLEAFQPDG